MCILPLAHFEQFSLIALFDYSCKDCIVTSFLSIFSWKAVAIGYPREKIGQDTDLGGGGNNYLVFIDNLEKDLTPSAIMEFLREKVAIASRAFIFPSLSSEFYTRGNILLDSKRNFEKLCNFLENPDQIIVSSSGR